MALFTDGALASIEDLRGHDTQLLNVATVEGIDVTRKLALAQEELGVELAGLLEQAMLSGQLAAPPAIEQVVVTPPLKLWHIFRTLEMVLPGRIQQSTERPVCGEAGSSTARWRSGRTSRLMQSGLGIAADPVPQAATPDAAGVGGRSGGRHLLRRHRMDERGGRRGGQLDTDDDPGIGQFLRSTDDGAGRMSTDGTCTAGRTRRR